MLNISSSLLSFPQYIFFLSLVVLGLWVDDQNKGFKTSFIYSLLYKGTICWRFHPHTSRVDLEGFSPTLPSTELRLCLNSFYTIVSQTGY